MKEFWNDRYHEDGWAYGIEPNAFVKEQLDIIQLQCEPSSTQLLFPAEGEGRNAVYAAKLGFDVCAFDISEAGKEKALQLAKSNHVLIDYQINGFDKVNYIENQFDGIVFCYTHFPAEIQPKFIQSMMQFVKPGGKIIFECFSENNLPYRQKNPQVGGPDNVNMLYTVQSVKSLFEGCQKMEVTEVITQLNEGKYHVGEACVVRMIGIK